MQLVCRCMWCVNGRSASIELDSIKYSQALDIADQVLRRDSNNMYALGIKGGSMLYLKNETGAISIFDKILQIHRNFV
jgi:hypothetical protein